MDAPNYYQLLEEYKLYVSAFYSTNENGEPFTFKEWVAKKFGLENIL